jgi:hypothetical protein
VKNRLGLYYDEYTSFLFGNVVFVCYYRPGQQGFHHQDGIDDDLLVADYETEEAAAARTARTEGRGTEGTGHRAGAFHGGAVPPRHWGCRC